MAYTLYTRHPLVHTPALHALTVSKFFELAVSPTAANAHYREAKAR